MTEFAIAAQRLIPALEELRCAALAMEDSFGGQLPSVHPDRRPSAANLLHYLALRQNDIRPLQQDLAALSLSSLGRLEAVTLATLNAVLVALRSMAGYPLYQPGETQPSLDVAAGPLLLERHTHALFGTSAGKRNVRIMVTVPPEAATDLDLVRKLLAAGMDVMRINCAEGDVAAWLCMIDNCRRAQRELGRPCKIYADLAGPTLRTGEVAPAGQLRKLQPKRNVRGEVLELAQCRILPDHGGVAGAGNTILVPPEFVARIRAGDLIRFKDAAGRKRTLAIAERAGDTWVAETNQTCYLEGGLPCYLERKGEKVAHQSKKRSMLRKLSISELETV